MFWFLQNVNFTLRNVVWKIFELMNHSIFMNFTKQHLQNHHTKAVIDIAFHPNFPLLMTGSYDKSTIIYDISSSPATIHHHLKDHTHIVRSVAFHPSLPLVATGSDDHSTIIYDISTSPPTIKHHLKDGNRDPVDFVTFHPRLALLAANIKDCLTIIYDISNILISPPIVKCRIRARCGRVTSVTFHPILPLFVTCSTSSILFYDISTSPPIIEHMFGSIASSGGIASSVLCVAFHPTLLFLATCSEDAPTLIYDTSVSPPTNTHSIRHHTRCVNSVAFHPRLPFLATGSADCSTILYDISTSRPTIKHHLKDHKVGVMSVAFHPSLPLLATCSVDKSTIPYNLEKML